MDGRWTWNTFPLHSSSPVFHGCQLCFCFHYLPTNIYIPLIRVDKSPSLWLRKRKARLTFFHKSQKFPKKARQNWELKQIANEDRKSK
jgi:hypothetical protein